jgi:serine-type D-Ala-D-Ala carboxypeptidase (penicillin-binding protein 5/6)
MKKFLLLIAAIIIIVLLGAVLVYEAWPKNSFENVQQQQQQPSPSPLLPVRDSSIGDFEINAESAISVAINNSGQEETLFEKNPNEKMKIASITKLMTAAVVLDNYDLSQKAMVSKAGVMQGGLLNVGDSFSADTLLHVMLVGPDNTAAYTFSEMMAKDKFAELMNQKAKQFGMGDTYYANSVGFGSGNHSTASDLVKLSYQLLKNYPSIFPMSAILKYNINDLTGGFHYRTTNADKLLAENIKWKDRIIGGKPGENSVAGGCLVLALKAPNNDGYIINVILNSKYRYTEMKKLVDWIDTAYQW